MSAFGELMGLQGHFVDQCDEAGIDVDVTLHKAGNSLSVQTGMYKRMRDREREREAQREAEDVEEGVVLSSDDAALVLKWKRAYDHRYGSSVAEDGLHERLEGAVS